MKFGSEEDLINAIKEGGNARQMAISQVYLDSDIRRRITYFIKYRNGNLDDLNEVLTESCVIFDRNIRNNKFNQESNFKTYLYSIAKNYYLGKLKSRPKKVKDSDEELLKIKDYQNPELIFLKEESRSEFHKILGLLSEKCRKVLEYWSRDYAFAEITKELDLGSVNSVRKQKFYCMKKLAKKLKEHPEFIPAKYHGRIL